MLSAAHDAKLPGKGDLCLWYLCSSPFSCLGSSESVFCFVILSFPTLMVLHQPFLKPMNAQVKLIYKILSASALLSPMDHLYEDKPFLKSINAQFKLIHKMLSTRALLSPTDHLNEDKPLVYLMKGKRTGLQFYHVVLQPRDQCHSNLVDRHARTHTLYSSFR